MGDSLAGGLEALCENPVNVKVRITSMDNIDLYFFMIYLF